MADGIEHLTERVQAVETTTTQLSTSLNSLSASVDQRFVQMDERFNAVDALLEQREYSEFAYERLEAKMDAGFSRLERTLEQFIDKQIETNERADRRLRELE